MVTTCLNPIDTEMREKFTKLGIFCLECVGIDYKPHRYLLSEVTELLESAKLAEDATNNVGTFAEVVMLLETLVTVKTMSANDMEAATFVPEMFAFKAKKDESFVAKVIKESLPDVAIGVDEPTKEFVNDIIRKFTEFSSVNPLMQGKHTVGLDADVLPDISWLSSPNTTRLLVPTVLFIGGATAVYYLHKNPIKYAWVQKTVTIVTSLITLLGASCAGIEVYQQLCTGIAKVAEAARDPSLYTPGDDDFLSGRARSPSNVTVEYSPELGDSIVELIAIPILSWFHLNATERKPNVTFIKDFVMRAKDTKDIGEATHFSIELLMKYVHLAVRFISEWANMPEWEKAVHPYPTLAEVDIPLRILVRKLQKREIEPTKSTANAVYKLEEDMIRILATLKPGSNEFIAAKGVEACIRELLKRHEHVWKKSDVRRRPYNVTLTGFAGVGKSVITQILALDVLPYLLEGRELYDHLQDPEASIYYFNTNANFADGFRHQTAVVVDDAGLVKDGGSGIVDEGILTVMRVDNDAPWTPDQASLANKESGFTMNNVLTIVSTNVLIINNITFPSLQHPEAVRRRLNGYFTTVKKEYAKGLEEDISRRRINPEACPSHPEYPDEISTDIWEFHPWNFELGRRDTTKAVLNYTEFVSNVIASAKKQSEFTEKYHNTRTARKERTAEKVLAGRGLTMADLLDDRKVAAARNHGGATESKEDFVSEMGVEDVPYEHKLMRLQTFLHDRYSDVEVSVDSIWSRVKTFKGTEFLDQIDKAMKPHVDAAYAQVNSFLDVVKKTVRENPFITACVVGTAILTIGAFFLPTEEVFTTHSGETKAKREAKKPTKKNRTLARSAKHRVHTRHDVGLDTEMGDHESNIIDLVCGNMFHFSICDGGRPVKSAWILGLAGTTTVAPLHYLQDLDDYIEEHPSSEVTVKIQPLRNGAESVTFTRDGLFDCAVNLVHNEMVSDEENQEDIVFLNFPNTMPRVRDIRSHMLSAADMLRFESKGKGKFVRINRTLLGLEKNICELEYTKSVLPSYAGKDMGVSNALFYATVSRAGDCGSPLFIKVGSDWKLASFHTAGSRDKGSSAKGVGFIMSRYLVDPYITNIGPNSIPVPSALKPKEVEYVTFYAETELGGSKLLDIEKRHQNTETSLIKGWLFDVGEPTLKIPARLRNFVDDDGNFVNVMEKARLGYSGPAFVIGEPLRHIGQAVLRHKINVCGVVDGVLSIHDACFGLGDLNPITRNTSAGYPEKIVMPKGFSAKHWFLGKDGEGTDAPGYMTLVSMVEKARDNMLSGKPHVFLFEDNLKDELVSVAKHKVGKTRLYSTGPLTLQVLTRMYFGKAMELLSSKKNLFVNWHAVGVNPYTDWPALYALLNEFPNALEMDHDSFDKRETAEILFKAFELLGALYPTATEEDKTMRRLIAEAIVMSHHMNGGSIYKWVGSNPSGNPLTITLNDIVNQMLNVYVLLKWYLKTYDLTMEDCDWLTVDWDEIFKNFRLVTMGDDVLITVGPMFDGITTKYFAQTLDVLGYKITNADKSDPYVNPVAPKCLEETTFIKRSFKKVNGVIRAPLELASIRKSYHWMDKSLTPKQYAEIVQMACYEFALHGKEVWMREAPILILSMLSQLGICLEDQTFEACLARTGTLLGFHN